MKLEDYENDSGKKVWLTPDEGNRLMEQTDDTVRQIAVGLGLRCGLRVAETVAVKPEDVVETPIGSFVRVWEGKGDKYRETPVPSDLAATINAYADVRPDDDTTPLVDVTTRTVRNWIDDLGEQLEEATGDVGWSYLGTHDLRATWGTQLTTEYEVEPGLVMEWGGWDNWETFRENYLGAYSLDAQKKQMGKVDWL